MATDTGHRGDRRTPSGQALLGAADIARLAGVRRPAVSNWRRRFGDFPEPVAGAASQPLFSLEQVREWCRAHGKPFEADSGDLLWQRVRAEIPDVRRAEFLAYLGRVLTEDVPVRPYTPGIPQQWGELAGELLSGQNPDRDYGALCDQLIKERGRSESDPFVAEWMASLAGVSETTTVLDPACGTGTLLAACLKRGATRAHGHERDPYVWQIATILLHLRYPSATVTTSMEDSLREGDDGSPPRTVDAVLCDPPFRDREWGHEELAEDPRWVYGMPPRGEGELAWVQHCLSRVRPGGRVVVLLPVSVSYRPGGRRLRANLLRAGALRAVLEVPEDQGTQAHRHVWVLVRPVEAEDSDGRVLLVGPDAGHEGAVRAVRGFVRGATVADGQGWLVVEAADLMDEEVDLRPARHLAGACGDRAAADYPPLLAELDRALERARSMTDRLRLEAGTDTPMTTIGDLLDEGAAELHRAPMAMATGAGEVPVLTVGDVRGGRDPSGRCDRVPGLVMTVPGDVVVAETVRGAPVRVVSEPGVALGPRLVLLRPVPGRTNPGFLAGAVAAETVSSARTHSGRVAVRSLRVPRQSPEGQRAYAEAWERLSRATELLEQIGAMGDRLAELGRRGLQEGELEPRETDS